MNREQRRSKPFSWRTFTSLTTTWSFLVLGLTGLVLFAVPQGRIAYWVDWRFLGLSKQQWGDIHIVTSIAFLIVGSFHLYFNWKAFLGHLRRKIEQGIRLRRELYVTTALTAIITLSALFRIPPIGYLMDLNDLIKDSWIGDESDEPPFGHAELLSLRGFCKKTQIDLNRASTRLESSGILVGSPEETLAEIAENNGISPKDVFGLIKDFKTETTPPSRLPDIQDGLTADEVLERYEGSGLGKKAVADACNMAQEEIAQCLQRLERAGLDARLDETLKTVADRNGIRPIRVLQTMLVDR